MRHDERADVSSDAAAQYFEYLDDIRASGAVNMFGARPHLMEVFGLSGDLAGAVLSSWMKTFKRDVPAAERAAQAFPDPAQ